MHEGNGYNGHYVSVIKKGKDWILINDLTVRKISFEEISKKNVYILFYEKEIED
jgi:ubiquitin C-terminal hydrolase